MGPAPHALSLSSRPLVDQVNMNLRFVCLYLLLFLFCEKGKRCHPIVPDLNLIGPEEKIGASETNPPGKHQ